MRISTTLLKSGAKNGLTLEQIGQILCRPDEDDTLPSLLERIVEKARLITDMMIKMQGKYIDNKLKPLGKSDKSRHGSLDIEQEDIRFGSGRQRAGSNFEPLRKGLTFSAE
jgi:hypothetical protein